jgi:hypothetical protein
VPAADHRLTASELKQVPGSLTLGGYDASRFTPSNITFDFADDNSRDLVVGVQSITAAGLGGPNGTVSLLPTPHLSFVDPSVSHLWLPASACDLFAQTFGLTYDPFTDLYLVNGTQRAALLAQHASITITVASDTISRAAVPLAFPYAAFDQLLTPAYPGIDVDTHYFPIRVAANESQFTLGRAFLQQAYLIADYERSTFSLNPCVFQEGAPPSLRTIAPLTPAPVVTSGTLAPAEMAAIACTVLVAIGLVVAGAWVGWRRRRSKRRARGQTVAAVADPAEMGGASVMELAVSERELAKIGAVELRAEKWMPSELESPVCRVELASPHGAAEVAAVEAVWWEMEGGGEGTWEQRGGARGGGRDGDGKLEREKQRAANGETDSEATLEGTWDGEAEAGV